MSNKRVGLFSASLVSSALLIAGCANPSQPEKEPVVDQNAYEATITRTTYGVAHITANDYPSLGYGEGYAAAEDHVCNIAHGIVVASGERAKYHGMGDQKQHFMSDVVVKALNIPSRADAAFEEKDQAFKDWVQGYADGYNRYLEDTGVDKIGSWCQGAEWVKPISAQDLFKRAVALANTLPRVAGMVVSAKPPKPVSVASVIPDLRSELETLKGSYLGSNAWAFGKDRTENGRGLLLGNPHYPWSGTNRFWEKHLTIPGKLNVYGVHLLGAPGVAIGFNEHVGWSHTVSASERTVFYQLKLVPNEPTLYYYDGEVRAMTKKTVNVEVAGKEKPVKHTVWFSHYGPIVQLPGIKWTEKTALAVRDANLNNYNMLSQWQEMGESKSMDELKQAHKKWNAMPWVNTMATSHDGRAVYIDGSNVGRLSEEAISLWKKSIQKKGLAKALYEKNGLVLLDGSDSRNEWTSHPEAVIDGNVPYSEKPVQDRSDYIFNANNSYWLTNVSEPMKEHSPLYGEYATARSLRTRMNAALVSDVSGNGYAGEDGKFSLKEMQAAIMGNDSMAAKLLVNELVTACQAKPTIEVNGESIDLAKACEVLANYDAKYNLDSKGSTLFREWINHYKSSQSWSTGALFEKPFDVNDPVNTPAKLADKNVALANLAKAVSVLNREGISLDASMGDTQFAYRGEHKVAIHGGSGIEGIANVIGQRNYDTLVEQTRGKVVEGSSRLTELGYAVTYGTSFIMSLSYTDNGPVAEAFLTYGQSGDPSSEQFVDQTRLFSEKAWRPILYTQNAIKANTLSTKELKASR